MKATQKRKGCRLWITASARLKEKNQKKTKKKICIYKNPFVPEISSHFHIKHMIFVISMRLSRTIGN